MMAQPMGHTRNRLLPLVALALLGPVLSVLAADPVQNFFRRDGSTVSGVAVRSGTGFTLAMASGVREFTAREITVSGRMTREASAVNQLLGIIEKSIKTRELDRAAQRLPDLDKAVAAFEAMLAPLLRSSLPGPAKRKAMQNAIAYYQAQRRQVLPTIAVLKLSGEAERAFAELRGRKASFETLKNLARYVVELRGIDGETPLAADRREATGSQLAALFHRDAKVLRTEALDSLRRQGDGAKTLALARLLAIQGRSAPEPLEELEALIEGSVKVVEESRQQLPRIIDSIMTFQKTIEIDQQPYREHLRVLRALDTCLAALQSIRSGKRLGAAEERLRQAREANAQEMKQADERRDLIVELSSNYRVARSSLASGRYERAAAEFDELARQLRVAKLPAQTWLADIAWRSLEARARQLLDGVNQPEGLTPKQMQEVAGQAQRFVDGSRDRLKQLGLDVPKFVIDIQRLKNYREFRLRSASIEAALADDPVTAWQELASMEDWLAMVGDLVHGSATRAWTQFRNANADDLLGRAADALFEKPGALKGERTPAQATYLTLYQALMAKKDTEAAHALAQRALADLKDAPKAPFVKTLLAQQLDLANIFAGAKQYERVADIFERIGAQHPDFMAGGEAKERIAEVLEKRARSFQRERQYAQAAELYRQICEKYPERAAAKGIYQALLQATLAEARLEPSIVNDSLLKQFNEFCGAYAGQVGELAELQEARDATVARLAKDWSEDPRAAVRKISSLNAAYPTFCQEINLLGAVLAKAVDLTAVHLNESSRMTPKVVLDAVQLLLGPRFRQSPGYKDLQWRYMQLMLRRAEGFLAAGKVIDAYDIYRMFLLRYPQEAAARDLKLQDKLDELRWRWWRESAAAPLRIKAKIDWAALGFWPLLWLFLLLRARWRGMREDRRLYYLSHTLLGLAAFALLLALFLGSSLGHSLAFAGAIIVPEAIFHSVGLFTYSFFPAIYLRRRIAAGRILRGLASAVGASAMAAALEHDIERLTGELPLLDHPLRLRLQRAHHTSQRFLKRGYHLMLGVLDELRQEMDADPEAAEQFLPCLIAAADLAFRAGDWDQAKVLLAEQLEHQPKDIDSREMLGNLHYDLGEYENAIAHLKVCLAARGNDDALWYRLGRSFFETERYVGAHKCFAAIQDKDRDSIFYGARAFARCNDFENTVQWYQQLMDEYPYDSEAIYHFASFLAAFNQEDKALKILKLIKPSDEEYAPYALTLQGMIHFRNSDIEKASLAYREALGVKDNFIPGLLGAGQMMLHAEETDQALRFFNAVREQEPDNPVANYFTGVLLQETEPEQAGLHLAKALATPQLRRVAAQRFGQVHFFNENYEQALYYFRIAEEEGELSPWFLYLYAYSMVMHGQAHDCEHVLMKMLGRNAQDPDWQGNVVNAMYTLGMKLFDHKEFKLAQQCLEVVREKATDADAVERLESMLEEIRFRMALSLLAKGEYNEAQDTVAELQLETSQKDRAVLYQFYMAACQVFLGDYEDAKSILEALLEDDPKNPRYLYQCLIAELGLGDLQGVNAVMAMLRQLEGLPPHLKVGMATVGAYLSTQEGKLNRAEQVLDKIPELADDFPGRAYVSRKATLARVYYLSCLNDTARLQDLIATLPDEERGLAANHHALAAIVTRENENAYNILLPYADQTPANQRLFRHVAGALAHEALLAGDTPAACERLAPLTAPPEVESVKQALAAAAALAAVDYTDPDSLAAAIGTVQKYAQNVADERLAHTLTHELAVLHLRHAHRREESEAPPDLAYQAWYDCIQFWFRCIFNSSAFWNMEQQRFTPAGRTPAVFSGNEITSINQKLKVDILLGALRAYLGVHFSRGDADGVQRHFALIETIGQTDGHLTTYLTSIKHDLDDLRQRIDRNDPTWDTWDFAIAATKIQVATNEALQVKDEPLKEQLALLLDQRNKYATPSAMHRHRRSFTTDLLEALQEGINGNFGAAGQQLEDSLNSLPSGVSLGQLDGALRLLCEACRNPRAYEGGKANLVKDFEGMYARTRSFNPSKAERELVITR